MCAAHRKAPRGSLHGAPSDRRTTARLGSVLVGEDEVQLLAGLVDDGQRLLALFLAAGLPDLTEGLHQTEAGLPDLAERLEVDTTGGFLPRRVGALVGRGTAGLGEREQLLAALALTGDQPLVLQQLEGGVHRAGAGLPRPAAALGDLLDHLVTVHGPVLEQGQDRGPHVSAPRPPPGSAPPPRPPGSGAEARPSEAGATGTARDEGPEGTSQALGTTTAPTTGST